MKSQKNSIRSALPPIRPSAFAGAAATGAAAQAAGVCLPALTPPSQALPRVSKPVAPIRKNASTSALADQPVAEPGRMITVGIEISLQLVDDPQIQGPGFVFHGGDVDVQRAAVIALNAQHAIVKRALAKFDVTCTRFLAGALLSERLHWNRKSSIGAALLAYAKEVALRKKADEPVGVLLLAEGLSKSAILAPLPQFPIFGDNTAAHIGERFLLTTVVVGVEVLLLRWKPGRIPQRKQIADSRTRARVGDKTQRIKTEMKKGESNESLIPPNLNAPIGQEQLTSQCPEAATMVGDRA